MCSIIGSFSREVFLDLLKLNQYRGEFSHSIAVFDPKIGIIKLGKHFGEFTESSIPKKREDQYYIGHVQAPTGGIVNDPTIIHPSEYNETFLWHNGILKDVTIKRLQGKYNNNITWDTRLLHFEIYNNGFDCLNNIDGSFGCVFIRNKPTKMYIFTTEIISLFMDHDYNLSSVPFDLATRIEPNIVKEINFDYDEEDLNHNIKDISTFESISSPYYFDDEE